MCLSCNQPLLPYNLAMKSFFLLILVLMAEASAQQSLNSYVPSTRLLRAKGYQIGVYTDSFVSSKPLDEKGKEEKIDDVFKNHAYGRLQTEIAGYYGATNVFQLGLGVRFRQNRSSYELPDGSEVNATATGLQSTFASMMFAFEQVDQMQYTLEGMFRYTPYSNVEIKEVTSATDLEKDMILGDQGNEISAGLGVTYFGKNNNFFTVRGGYRRPGSEISHELYWQAEGAMAWRYVALIAGVDGVSSLNNDPYEDKPEDRPVYNSPTNLYNTENREWITPYVGLNLALGNTWRVEFKGAQTVAGKSTDLGTTFGINLIRRSDKSATKLVDNKFKTYDLEATVTKVSPKKEYVVIDKGLADDFNKGMRIDLFEFDYIGGNILVATGVIVQVKADTSIVKITQRYNMKKEIKEGLIGRTSLK